MTRRPKLWLAAVSLFALINAAGAGYAAALSEGLHAGVHVALLLPSIYVAWRLLSRAAAGTPLAGPATDDRLEHIQQAVDSVAVEVERIGEAQRFTAKLQQDRAQTRG